MINRALSTREDEQVKIALSASIRGPVNPDHDNGRGCAMLSLEIAALADSLAGIWTTNGFDGFDSIPNESLSDATGAQVGGS